MTEPDFTAPGAQHGEAWPVLAPAPQSRVERAPGPSFSVVIAAYQAAATVGAAIDSALAQTRPAVEIVVCDDGSTDDTVEVLAGYGSAITVVRQTNGGEAAAKNAAVHVARGDWVVVLDADDIFLPRRLEALAWLAAHRPDLDVLTSDAILEADGVAVRRCYHEGWAFPVDDQRAAILERNFVFGLAAVRRATWIAAKGFDEHLSRATDWEFWQRLVLSGSRVGLVDVPLARYRLTAGSLSSDRVRLVEARLAVLERTGRRSDLSAHERDVLTSAVHRQRRELLVRRADAALARGGRPARAAFARIATGRGFATKERIRAALATASPALVARRRRRRSGGTTEIGAGLRVPSDDI